MKRPTCQVNGRLGALLLLLYLFPCTPPPGGDVPQPQRENLTDLFIRQDSNEWHNVSKLMQLHIAVHKIVRIHTRKTYELSVEAQFTDKQHSSTTPRGCSVDSQAVERPSPPFLSTSVQSDSLNHLPRAQTEVFDALYSPTLMGIDGLGSLPTVGKRTLDRFQDIAFPDGANVNLASNKHSTVSVRRKRYQCSPTGRLIWTHSFRAART